MILSGLWEGRAYKQNANTELQKIREELANMTSEMKNMKKEVEQIRKENEEEMGKMKKVNEELKQENDTLVTMVTRAKLSDEEIRDKIQQIVNKHKLDNETLKDTIADTTSGLCAKMKDTETAQAKIIDKIQTLTDQNDKLKYLTDGLTNIERNIQEPNGKQSAQVGENAKKHQEAHKGETKIRAETEQTESERQAATKINAHNRLSLIDNAHDSGNPTINHEHNKASEMWNVQRNEISHAVATERGNRFYPLTRNKPVLIHDSNGRNRRGTKLLNDTPVQKRWAENI